MFFPHGFSRVILGVNSQWLTYLLSLSLAPSNTNNEKTYSQCLRSSFSCLLARSRALEAGILLGSCCTSSNRSSTPCDPSHYTSVYNINPQTLCQSTLVCWKKKRKEENNLVAVPRITKNPYLEEIACRVSAWLFLWPSLFPLASAGGQWILSHLCIALTLEITLYQAGLLADKPVMYRTTFMQGTHSRYRSLGSHASSFSSRDGFCSNGSFLLPILQCK